MKKTYFILLISLLLSACSKDVMDRTVFIPDEDDARLPAYTEWGYNSFGAEYERDYFLVSQHIIPCKITYNSNLHQLQFALIGTSYYNNYNKEMSLLFIFPSTQINDFKDLMPLNNVAIDLSSNDCTVKIVIDGNETILSTVSGELYFKRAQLLRIDDQVNRVILSGIFDIRFLHNGLPSTISNGRFDMGITNNVFYSY